MRAQLANFMKDDHVQSVVLDSLTVISNTAALLQLECYCLRDGRMAIVTGGLS